LTTGHGEDVGRLKVDWLTLVFPAAAAPAVVDRVSVVMGPAELTPKPLNLYRSSWRWETGAVLAFSEEGLNADTCCLVLSGSVVDYFAPSALWEFMVWAAKEGASCSRLDLAFDDFSRRFLRLSDVHAAADAGNFAGFKRHKADQEKTRSGMLLSDGHTFGLRGKNGGGRQVQIYDKLLESKGEIDAVRLEARFFKDLAELTFQNLVASTSFADFNARIGANIGGSISFVDRGTHTHLARMPVLSWWADIVSLLGRLKLQVRRVAPPLQHALAYCRDTWAASWAVAWEIAEGQGLDADAHICMLARLMVERGKEKLDRGWRPGARSLGLDFVELLSA
jgi:DNA relaxase NicK